MKVKPSKHLTCLKETFSTFNIDIESFILQCITDSKVEIRPVVSHPEDYRTRLSCHGINPGKYKFRMSLTPKGSLYFNLMALKPCYKFSMWSLPNIYAIGSQGAICRSNTQPKKEWSPIWSLNLTLRLTKFECVELLKKSGLYGELALRMNDPFLTELLRKCTIKRLQKNIKIR